MTGCQVADIWRVWVGPEIGREADRTWRHLHESAATGFFEQLPAFGSSLLRLFLVFDVLECCLCCDNCHAAHLDRVDHPLKMLGVARWAYEIPDPQPAQAVELREAPDYEQVGVLLGERCRRGRCDGVSLIYDHHGVGVLPDNMLNGMVIDAGARDGRWIREDHELLLSGEGGDLLGSVREGEAEVSRPADIAFPCLCIVNEARKVRPKQADACSLPCEHLGRVDDGAQGS